MAPLTRSTNSGGANRSVPAAVLQVEPESLEILDVIEPVESLLGYSRQELLGRSLKDLHPSTAGYTELLEELTTRTHLVRRSLQDGSCVYVKTKETTHPVEIEATRVSNSEDSSYRVVYRSRPCPRSMNLLPKRFREIVDANPTPIAVVDNSERYLYANPAYCELVGFDQREVIGTSLQEVLDSDTLETIEPYLETVRTEGSVSFETERLVSPEERRVFEATYTHFEDEGGSITGVIATLNDVTERKRREEELESMFDGMDDAVFVHAIDGPFVVVNETAVERYGYTETEFYAMSPRVLDVPEEAQKVGDRLERIRQKGAAVFETVHETKSGTQLPVEISSAMIQYKGGPAVLSIARDISRRKETERRFEKLFANSSAAIAQVRFVSGEPVVESVNPPFTEWFVSGEETVEGNRVASIFASSTEAYDRSDLYRRVRREQNVALEVSRETAEGVRDFQFQSIPIDPENGAYFFVYTDITERKERERRLVLQRDELATLNRLNEVIFDLIQMLVDAESHDRLMQTVCTELASSSLFESAWIGEKRPEEPTLQVQSSAMEGESPEHNVFVAGESVTATGYLQKALETGTVQIVQHPEEYPRSVEQDGIEQPRDPRSVAAIPLKKDDEVVAVLHVTSSREYAFRSREITAIESLGKILEFANSAIKNKRVLTTDSIVELELDFSETEFPLVRTAQDLECTITLDGAVYSATEKTQTAYVTVEGVSAQAFLERVRTESQVIQAVQLEATEAPGLQFELVLEVPTMDEVELRHNATLRDVKIDATEARCVFEHPLATDTRAVRGILQSEYPSLKFLAKREIELEPNDPKSVCSTLRATLTDRQYEILKNAFLSGYFEWPRQCTTEELADPLDISPSTVQYHLRIGLQKLIQATFERTEEPD